MYLHIGLPKTGTTYLQRHVFPKLYSIDYLDKPRSNFLRGGPGPMYGIMDRAFKYSSVIWRQFGDEIFAHVIGGPKEVCATRRSLLISDEGIGTGGRRPFLLRMHLEEFSKKASEWGFTSLKIICAFRRQDQWLGSHYAQISGRVKDASQSDFEAFLDRVLDEARDYYSTGILLDYKTLRDQLVLGAGRENVLMLPYEMLETDPASYLDSILGFIQAKDDEVALSVGTELGTASGEAKDNARSLSKDAWAIRDRVLGDTEVIWLRPGWLFRAFGLPTKIPLCWPEFGREESIRLTKDLKEKVLRVYARSNRDLAADLGMNLEQYGYY